MNGELVFNETLGPHRRNVRCSFYGCTPIYAQPDEGNLRQRLTDIVHRWGLKKTLEKLAEVCKEES